MKFIFEENVPSIYRAEFIAAVKQYSESLGIDPNWLMAVIYFESAGSFSSSITNPYTGAVGLIQFMPATAAHLQTSVSELASMSAVAQLYYVEKYYYPYRNKIKKYVDLYLATFFPAAIGKEDSYVLQTKKLSPEIIANVNPVFDLNNNKEITVGEITKVITDKIPTSWRAYFLKGSKKKE